MLLQTKFFAPASNPKTIQRHRLFGLITPDSGKKLSLVIAPAGYGKTTLVSQWLHSTDVTFAWLSLDVSDNDTRRFWQYAIGAFQRIDPAIALEANKLLAKTEFDHMEAVITVLVNSLSELCIQYPKLVLVFDDFHHIQDFDILRNLVFLIDYLPSNVHIIITARTEPVLPLSRWRVKNYLNEIYAADLAFSDDECYRFFRDFMAMAIDRDEAKQIRDKTEGWVAAMQLAAISKENLHQNTGIKPAICNYHGADRLINDYVLTEILEQQPDPLKAFLLQSSCLVRLSGQLCDTVLNISSSQEILENLEQSNLFIIPLDTSHNWYRYHDLFRESLLHRIHLENPEQVTTIQRKAIHWLLEHEQVHESIDQLVQLQDWNWLKEVLQDHGNTLIHDGNHLAMLKWINMLPIDQLEQSPQLQMLKIWCLFFSNRLDTIPPLLESLIDTLGHRTAESPPNTDEALLLTSEISLISSYLARAKADTKSASDLTRQVLANIDHANMPLKSMTFYGIGIDCFNEGNLDDAERALLSAIQYGKFERKPSVVISSSGLLTWILYYKGELDRACDSSTGTQAWLDSCLNDPSQPKMISCWQNSAMTRIYLEKSEAAIASSYLAPLLEHLELGTEPGQHIIIQFVHAQLLYTQGKFSQAIDCIEDAQNLYEHKKEVILFEPPGLAALKAKCQAKIGQYKQALNWAEINYENSPEYSSSLNKEEQFLAVAHLFICSPDSLPALIQKGLGVLDKLARTMVEQHHLKHQIELQILRAIAYQKLHQTTQAQENIAEALRLASKDRFITLFKETGSLLVNLIEQCDSASVPVSFRSEVLLNLDVSGKKNNGVQNDTRQKHHAESASGIGPNGTASVGQSKLNAFSVENQSLIEPLSQRELEVLGLIYEGHANKQIASKLLLSPATVKAHIRNIYGKLNVKSRTEALAKARNRNLI
ncbi:MAG: helix-turn-helix transcriptional regulator [Gammaproteobacteria bacterium]|nr:MAG: helix-turn-helix transcriptional regulator [Gammaproteobacteria bacterium]